jgi:hypothetical protein
MPAAREAAKKISTFQRSSLATIVTCHLSPPKFFSYSALATPKIDAPSLTLVHGHGAPAVRHGHSGDALQHSELAQRLSSSASDSELEKHDTYTNVSVTWYPNDTRPDACMGKNHQDSDWVRRLLSLSDLQYTHQKCLVVCRALRPSTFSAQIPLISTLTRCVLDSNSATAQRAVENRCA